MADKLVLRSINELLNEHFYIPYYQRGYRWTAQQVNELLNDIWAFASKPKSKEEEFYCLQPVVVKQKEWSELGQELKGWEVVDGQQRLTTIYIIISYLAKEFLKVESLKDEYGREIYSLRYETRHKSGQFLKNITEDKSNIDFYHIALAYKTVEEWFTSGLHVKDRTDKNKFLDTLLGKMEDERSVQVIWYHVEEKVDSIELFARLNIGKIPLTNAELIKALFLSASSFKEETDDESFRRKIEISQLWDEMEQRLGDEHFWSFITNDPQSNYATKIELLFDSIAKKTKDEKDPLYTFIYFLKKSRGESQSLWELWLSIEQYYLTLSQWHKSKNLYHKIGYLVTVGQAPGELVEHSLRMKKTEFETHLDKKICSTIDFSSKQIDFSDLNFEDHYTIIDRILTLFNIESIRTNENITEYYPFKSHKGIWWSLEHIHAQKSELLDRTKKDQWLEWLGYHEKLIQELQDQESDVIRKAEWESILEDISQLIPDKITWDKFNSLSNIIIEKFSGKEDDHSIDIHALSNLALLSLPDNAALNNSVFEVKRREIIKMDKEGKYIPICTRRVFLKYYTESPSSQQYYFWGKADRDSYLKEIKTVLKNYLPQEKENLN